MIDDRSLLTVAFAQRFDDNLRANFIDRANCQLCTKGNSKLTVFTDESHFAVHKCKFCVSRKFPGGLNELFTI